MNTQVVSLLKQAKNIKQCPRHPEIYHHKQSQCIKCQLEKTGKLS